MKATHVIAALLAQAGTACAFSTGGAPLNVEVASRIRGDGSLRGSSAPAEVPRQPAASTNSGLLAGAFAAVAVLIGSRKKATVSRNSWTREPAYPGMEQEGDPSRGPSFRTWINLKRRASKVIGRQRFFRQQKFLAEAGIQCAKGGYHKWYPNRDQHNLYKGPESHPNNPDFPAASPGYQAIRAWAPAQLADSTRPSRRSSAFVSGRFSSMRTTIGSAKRAVRGGRAAAAIVLHAHKKAASSTRNQGNKSSPKYWGVAKAGLQGNAVKVGQLLVSQKGYNWYPGANVVKCGDFSLRSLKDGIVQWRGSYKHREVSVVPWEYVRTKCSWVNPNTLGPKVYEPWMGTRTTGKRDHILRLRKEWLETEEGKEWMAKKEEKKQKQKEIQQKIRAFKKMKKAGKVTERVAAGESDSEKEA